VAGAELHVVERAGEGPLVVLVHGSLDRSAAFARVAAAPGLEGRHVVRYDRRGYGRSRREADNRLNLRSNVDDVLAVLDGRPAVLVGHSFGGLVGLAAAVQRPDLVRAVGAFEAPLPWLAWWPADTAGGSAMAAAGTAGDDPEGAAEAFLRRMIGDARWEGLPEGTRADRRREGHALVAELASVRPSAPGEPPPLDLGAVPVPVLAGRGTRSPAHLRRAAEELAATTGCDLVSIDGADHGAHLTHPEAFAASFAARVADLASGGAPPTAVDEAG